MDGARLYRLDEGVGDSLPRHLRWHAVAHDLLGLPPAPPPPLPDYVSSLNTWDRDVVNRMLRRVEQVTGRRWLEAVGKKLHFSEWTLYGVYADQFERAEYVTLTAESLCHSNWDNVPTHRGTSGSVALLRGTARRGVHDLGEVTHAAVGTTCRPRQRIPQLSACGYATGIST